MPSLMVRGANASSSKSWVTESSPSFHGPLRKFAQWLCTVYHDITIEGIEHVPSHGPAIIAANHPTYLDPGFLMIELNRPIRFMAYERPMRIPVLGHILRAYGVIPVDVKKPGRASFEAAVKVLRSGMLFGIFPEGGRTKKGAGMNPFKSGVARLALITGAPIIPATITGGRRVWRRGQSFPKPGKIRVVFHPPITVDSSERLKWKRDKTLERGVIKEVMKTINRAYRPSLRKEARMRRLWRGTPPRLSPLVEGIPIFFLAILAAFGAAAASFVAPLIVYSSWLGLERLTDARGRFVIWTRHLLPWITLGVISVGIVSKVLLVAGAVLTTMGVIWLTIFRFPLYRRVRSLMLVLSYGALLMHVLRGGA
ncbi:MAG: hypothetical protein COB53_13365 [Elusimicrobia bacterium]|nr:MAG: hypothetical protein COB53_13365 [Elusimicrobiota bacterium]